MVAFVALCKGFLWISAHFDLWRYFFAVNLQKKREMGGRQELHMPMGCVGILLWNNWVGEYPSMRLSMFNKGCTCSGSTSRMMPPPLYRSSPGA